MQQLIIRGGEVVIEEVTHVQTVALRDLMPHIERPAPPVTMPLLPAGTRTVYWNEENPDNQVLELLVQVDPTVRTITDRRTRAGETTDTAYRVSLPYLLFHVRLTCTNGQPSLWNLEDYRVFQSREPITTMDQEVCTAMLPNVYSDGRICFGNTGVRAGEGLTTRIDNIVNTYYLTTFDTSHLVRNSYLPFGGGEGPTGLTRWAEATEQDPNCWRNFPEWAEDSDEHNLQIWRPIQSLFGVPLDRTTPIAVEGDIPDLPIRPTFGVAEEWVRRLDEQDLFRLRTAIDNHINHPVLV